MGHDKPRAAWMGSRVEYAERLAKYRPPKPPSSRAWTEDEDATFAIWLWAMAQPFRGLNKTEAESFADQFHVKIWERPIGEHGAIWGEAYSQPGTIAVHYDDEHDRIAFVAVERVWPN